MPLSATRTRVTANPSAVTLGEATEITIDLRDGTGRPYRSAVEISASVESGAGSLSTPTQAGQWITLTFTPSQEGDHRLAFEAQSEISVTLTREPTALASADSSPAPATPPPTPSPDLAATIAQLEALLDAGALEGQVDGQRVRFAGPDEIRRRIRELYESDTATRGQRPASYSLKV
jgi:hypothetical protein